MSKRSCILAIIATGLGATFLGAWMRSALAEEPNASTASETKQAGQKFHARLLKIANEYPSYGHVDEELRVAPTLCDDPSRSGRRRRVPAYPRLSAAGDEASHGKKLYFLFAKNRPAYVELNKDSDLDGQVIVKESWTTKEWLKKGAAANSSKPKTKGEKTHSPVEKYGLFIMFHAGADTADTDQGWVYGTVSADGKTVTSAGRVKSCMECHEQAPHGRLFGIAKTKSE